MARIRLRALVIAAAVALLALTAAGSGGATVERNGADAGKIVFLSTQLNAIQESEAFRSTILKGFNGDVQKIDIPLGNATFFFDRIKAESQAGKGTISLLGGLHGDFATIPEYLTNLTPLAKQLKNAGIPADLLKLGKMGTARQLYIPWMQATYIMVANKKALSSLPKGANVQSLTYNQFLQWAKNLAKKYGGPQVGFPAGSTGLMPRFLQGYLVPGFTGRLVTKYTSSQAAQGWNYLHNLWKYVHPQSLAYNFMQDPLLNGEVLVAWDHVARLTNAFKSRPNDFVAFPAPSGPKGRAYLPVLAGLAIPKTSPNPSGAKALIKYLTGVSPQARTLSTEGFFPVVASKLSQKLGTGLLSMAGAVKRQQRAKNALPSLLPVGLGSQGGNFNRVFTDTFTRIVVNGENVRSVLADQGKKLQVVLDAAGAPCWKPDPPSNGTCKVG
jgi:multiple sugar transport system substrate-binding protein